MPFDVALPPYGLAAPPYGVAGLPYGAAAASSLGALPAVRWSGLGGWLHRRALWASIVLPLVSAGVAALIASLSTDWTLWSMSAGMLSLGFAQLMRAAAVLQRTCYGGSLRRFPSPRTATVSLVAVVLTAVATVLLASGVGAGDPEESQSFGFLIGVVALLHLWRRRTLQWPIYPREPMYRRFHSMMPMELFRSLRLALLCAVIAIWSDRTAFWAYATLARLCAGALVLLCGAIHAENLQNITSLRITELPTGGELAEALAEPLDGTGPGLGRWIAMAALAQAIAFQPTAQQVQGGWHPTAFAKGLPGVSVLPFAAEVFSRVPQPPPAATTMLGAVAAPPSVVPGMAPGSVGFTGSMDTAVRADIATGLNAAPLGGNASWPVPLGGNASWAGSTWGDASRSGVSSGASSSIAGSSGGLFAVYLRSGLEVFRELTLRLQCLAAAMNRRGVDALLPAQLGVLGTSVIELLPLVRLAAVGLSSWICLSRDMDQAGVVQREEALRKVIYELCGLYTAFERTWPLSGVAGLSEKRVSLLQDAQEEVRHSLERMLQTFEESGLRMIKLPAQYRRLILSLWQ